MPGNTWLVNATDFGHADCMDETFAAGIDVRIILTLLFVHMLGRINIQLYSVHVFVYVLLRLFMHCVVTHLLSHAVLFIESKFRVHC